MRETVDCVRAGEFRKKMVLHVGSIVEAQLRAAVYTAEANKEPWWKRALGGVRVGQAGALTYRERPTSCRGASGNGR